MNLTIERKCEQCGGEMEILETDNLIECPWCGVRHFIDYGKAKYVLPHKEISGELIHVPYLRIKGSLFTCDHSGVHHKVVDSTVGATQINVLPHTLGHRPQTMKLQFASDSSGGTFLKHSMNWQDAIDTATSLQHGSKKTVLYKEWIGETFSTIYQPIILQNNLVLDGVTGDKLAKTPTGKDIFAPIRLKKLGWSTTLLPTLCPNCGWDMPSTQTSVIHLCPNCNTCWRNLGGNFRQVKFATSLSENPQATYLPFWQMQVDFEGIPLRTLADFIKIMNIPRVIQAKWQETPLNFFCPAFKIRPKIFIRIASQLTSSQQPISTEQTLPNSTTPVTLHAHDAEEAIKLILANSAVAKRNILPILAKIKQKKIKTNLLFLPFLDNGYELCQEQLKLVINKHILKWGTKL